MLENLVLYNIINIAFETVIFVSLGLSVILLDANKYLYLATLIALCLLCVILDSYIDIKHSTVYISHLIQPSVFWTNIMISIVSYFLIWLIIRKFYLENKERFSKLMHL